MELALNFDASQYDPTQLAPTHPVGKYRAQVANTEVKPTKTNDGGYLEVTFKTEAGSIPMRYNLWNPNQQAVDIAHRQLSALCHATGVFRLPTGHELRNAWCMIEVTAQADPKYTQVTKVMDVNGNEPTKQGSAPPAAPASAPAPAQGAPAWQAPQSAPAWSPQAATPAPAVPNAGQAPPPWAASAPQQPGPAPVNGQAPPPWAAR